MSRAMNVTLSVAEVRTLCTTKNIAISAIETLPGTGSHVVCVTSEGAEQLRGLMKQHLIEGKVKRYPFYRVPSSW